MLFNSLDFAVFLPIVFACFWSAAQRGVRAGNVVLLVASYVFYGWWDWRFLLLIAFSSLVDYTIGQKLTSTRSEAQRRLLVMCSLGVNLGLLGFFKYFNFFMESFEGAFALMGNPIAGPHLDVILPVGISFYTFQTLSYTIDIYRRRIEPTRDVLAFFAFVSFFPQLVAGPIERAQHLLPQFLSARKFDDSTASDGLRQMLWGLFKKCVVADNCAPFVDRIFADTNAASGPELALAAVLFGFQIYCDFSGYSDIAIGAAKLFGFELMQNFRTPYFACNVSEFWRRWHISLSSWFRDYVFIPLGGSRRSRARTIANIVIVFVLSGLWHGANWTFAMWGLLHAVFMIPTIIRKQDQFLPIEERPFIPGLRETVAITATFCQVTIAWVFFRAASIGDAWAYLGRMVAPNSWLDANWHELAADSPRLAIAAIGLLMVVERFQQCETHGLAMRSNRPPRPVRWLLYLILVFGVLYWSGDPQEFIYFQF